MSFRLPFSNRPVHSATSSQLEVKSMRDLDIAEVAQRSGVPASALRYYEEKRLIASIGRRGLRRLFDPGVIERLALIALGRAAGFSLDEIRSEEHTSELQSLMRISYAVFCLKKKNKTDHKHEPR